jgi:hypothetical protein
MYASIKAGRYDLGKMAAVLCCTAWWGREEQQA